MRADLYRDILEFNPHGDWMIPQAMSEFFLELSEFGRRELAHPVQDINDIEQLLGNHEATVLMMTGMMEHLFSSDFMLEDGTTSYNVIDDYLTQHPDLDTEERDWLTGLRRSYMSIYQVDALTDSTATLSETVLKETLLPGTQTPVTLTLEDQKDQLDVGQPIAARLVMLPEGKIVTSLCWLPLSPAMAEEAATMARQVYDGFQKMVSVPGEEATPEEAAAQAKAMWASVIMGHWMVYVALSQQVRQEEARDTERQKRKAQNILSAVTGKP